MAVALTTAAVAGAISSIAGAAATVAPIVGVAAGGLSLYNALSQDKGGGDLPALPASPAAPDPGVVMDEAKKKLLRGVAARTRNILTSPVGLTQEPTTRRSLLGGA